MAPGSRETGRKTGREREAEDKTDPSDPLPLIRPDLPGSPPPPKAH